MSRRLFFLYVLLLLLLCICLQLFFLIWVPFIAMFLNASTCFNPNIICWWKYICCLICENYQLKVSFWLYKFMYFFIFFTNIAYNSSVMHQNNMIIHLFYGFVVSLDTFCNLKKNFRMLGAFRAFKGNHVGPPMITVIK